MVLEMEPLFQVPPQFRKGDTVAFTKVVAPDAKSIEAPGNISLFTTLLCMSIAPAVALCQSEAPSSKWMAPAATSASGIQMKTKGYGTINLPIHITKRGRIDQDNIDSVVVARAPSILKINTASGSH